jgi:hypothetical protein
MSSSNVVNKNIYVPVENSIVLNCAAQYYHINVWWYYPAVFCTIQ